MGCLYYESEDGKCIPVKELQGLSGKGTILAMVSSIIRREDMERLQERLSKDMGQKVVVVDGCVKQLLRLEE